MELTLDVDGHPHHLVVRRTDGVVEVEVGGRSLQAQVRALGRLTQVQLGGRTHLVEIRGLGEALLDGRLVRFHLSAFSPTLRADASGGSGLLRAMMPGVIVSLKAQLGERVRKGQVVLLLEAMKMQNAVVAPIDGTVTAIYVAQGHAVEQDAPLLEVRADG